MLLSINAMSVNEIINSVNVDLGTLVLFGLAALFAIGLLWKTIAGELQSNRIKE